MIAYVNGQFLSEDEAVLNVSDLSIQRGYGVFDFFRTKNYIPLFLENYLDRFFNSASLLHLHPVLSREEIRQAIFSLQEKNNQGDSGFRMILTGGYAKDSYTPVNPNLVIIQQELQLPNFTDFEKGISVITHEYERELPAAKSINYLIAVWLQEKISQKKASDVIYHKDGFVSELPRANIFIVTRDDKIITPSRNMLFGVTRMKLIELITRNGLPFEERDLGLDEVFGAKEVFMTNTTRRIFPIVAIDDKTIGTGSAGNLTRKLREYFMDMEDAYVISLQPAKIFPQVK